MALPDYFSNFSQTVFPCQTANINGIYLGGIKRFYELIKQSHDSKLSESTREKRPLLRLNRIRYLASKPSEVEMRFTF